MILLNDILADLVTHPHTHTHQIIIPIVYVPLASLLIKLLRLPPKVEVTNRHDVNAQ